MNFSLDGCLDTEGILFGISYSSSTTQIQKIVQKIFHCYNEFTYATFQELGPYAQ